MPTIVGILTLMGRINFVLSWVEYEKSCITSGAALKFWSYSAQTLLCVSRMQRVVLLRSTKLNLFTGVVQCTMYMSWHLMKSAKRHVHLVETQIRLTISLVWSVNYNVVIAGRLGNFVDFCQYKERLIYMYDTKDSEALCSHAFLLILT